MALMPGWGQRITCSSKGAIGRGEELDDLLDGWEPPHDLIWEFLKRPLGGPRKLEPDGYDGGTMCYE